MGIKYVRAAPPPSPPPRQPTPEDAGPRPAEPRCASCNDRLPPEPVTRDGKPYCCDGCADGGPCIC